MRRYEADEQLTLLVSIDNRQTMAPTPELSGKWQVACWLVEAMADIAFEGRDRFNLHQLFGPDGKSQRISSLAAARRFLERSTEALRPTDVAPDLSSLARFLPPAAVWVILSDLYFDDRAGRLAQAIHRALEGPRGVMVLEIDSWPHERAYLGQGARRIEGPGRDLPLELVTDTALTAAIGERIASHRNHWLEGVQRHGFEHHRWQLPAEPRLDRERLERFFRDCFLEDEKSVGNLFRRGR